MVHADWYKGTRMWQAVVIAVHGYAVHRTTHIVLVVSGVWQVGVHNQLRAV